MHKTPIERVHHTNVKELTMKRNVSHQTTRDPESMNQNECACVQLSDWIGIFDDHSRKHCGESRKDRVVTGTTAKTQAVHAASPTKHRESILERARKLAGTE